MKAIPILFALLASSMAAAQTQPPAEPKPKAPLNLKLEDAPRAAAPRINFENPDEKAAKSTLAFARRGRALCRAAAGAPGGRRCLALSEGH
jgi:hypothetical protein